MVSPLDFLLHAPKMPLSFFRQTYKTVESDFLGDR